jgi:hypothetical protein
MLEGGFADRHAVRQHDDGAFNAGTGGTFFIGIKYDAGSIVGFAAPSPTTTVHYDFSTTGVPSSTSGLDLIKK